MQKSEHAGNELRDKFQQQIRFSYEFVSVIRTFSPSAQAKTTQKKTKRKAYLDDATKRKLDTGKTVFCQRQTIQILIGSIRYTTEKNKSHPLKTEWMCCLVFRVSKMPNKATHRTDVRTSNKEPTQLTAIYIYFYFLLYFSTFGCRSELEDNRVSQQ